MGSMVIVSVLMTTMILSSVNGYATFRSMIPNGLNVPNPCNPSAIWSGVGHQNMMGGGPLNPFGADFKANSYVWNNALCQKDSDGDGLTNGQELGDPNCLWTNGSMPASTTNLRHPGICEPLNSPNCIARNSWLNCTAGAFNCPATNSPGVQNYTMRFPVSSVPTNVTTYTCHNFALPSDAQYDIIGIEPVVDNAQILHHMILYGCTSSPGVIDQSASSNYQCGMGNATVCQSMIGLWAVGATGLCLPSQYGFRIGPGGYQFTIMQLHWSNLQSTPNLTDSSGMRIYYTNQLRPNRGGILGVGQSYLNIPPGRQQVVANGSCTFECTNQWSGPIYLSSAVLHMHLLGKSGQIAIYRNDAFLQMLDDVAQYQYDSPQLEKFDNPIALMPGDEIRVMCVYQSTQRSGTTYYGEGTLDEMCFAFVAYYPMMIGVDFCGQWKTVSICTSSGNIQFEYCDFKTYLQLLGTLTGLSCSSDCTTTSCGVIMNGIYATNCLSFADVRSFTNVFIPGYMPALTECVLSQPPPSTCPTNQPYQPTIYHSESPDHTRSSLAILLGIVTCINYHYLI